MSTLRNWDYYNMTETFTELHEKAGQGHVFSHLYDTILSRENILLAFRMIKTNSGSKTPGTDGKTIKDIQDLSEEELVNKVRDILRNYNPKKVRRIWIEKDNGKWRPLGIPCIVDRVIQQCFKQILEPIVEAKFFKHSYGFRPLRSAHNAMARVQHLINHGQFHFVVDIDIKSFFDNVNHTLLKKQLWNIGIRDRKVLACISKMLKSEINGEGIPSKGTPQGGILSPLLSNVVLNDLDQWVAGQWETFPLHKSYSSDDARRRAGKTTNLKQGYLVRYADDFKILCRDSKTAQRWYHAVRLFLKERLKLDISPEKSKIVNLRKRESEFLGFTIRANKKGQKRVAHTGIIPLKKKRIKEEAKRFIRRIKASPTAQNVQRFNSFVLGIHNYFNRATHVSLDFSRIAFDLKTFIYNKLRLVGKEGRPYKPPPIYRKLFSLRIKTFQISNMYIFPIGNVKTVNAMNFSTKYSLYTDEGRNNLHKKLRPDIQKEISYLMKGFLPNQSVEYMDNRISRYSMRMGKCEITAKPLYATNMHCHHYIPKSLGGSDKFENLRVLHEDVHRLIHMRDTERIIRYLNRLNIDQAMLNKINKYRRVCELESIDSFHIEA